MPKNPKKAGAMTKKRQITIDNHTADLLDIFANKTQKSISEIIALVCTKSRLENLADSYSASAVFGKEWDTPLSQAQKAQIERENTHFPED